MKWFALLFIFAGVPDYIASETVVYLMTCKTTNASVSYAANTAYVRLRLWYPKTAESDSAHLLTEAPRKSIPSPFSPAPET